MDEVKTASAVAPYEGKGDRLRWMRCQPKRRTLLIPLSDASDSDLTANLSLALRAARVNARCPPEAAVRAGNCAEGRTPPTHPARRRASPRRLRGNASLAASEKMSACPEIG